jgi:outer membrane murein-binding lipoprotein Lpp
MTLRDEALSLVSLLPNPQGYSEKLGQLLAAKAEADAAIANAKAVEKATSETTAAKLEASTALLQALTAQSDELENKNSAARAKIEAAETDLARRESELDVTRQQHAAEVARSLQMFASREAELKQKGAAQSEAHSAHAADMQREHDRLSAHHRDLRSIIASARQGIAAV